MDNRILVLMDDEEYAKQISQALQKRLQPDVSVSYLCRAQILCDGKRLKGVVDNTVTFAALDGVKAIVVDEKIVWRDGGDKLLAALTSQALKFIRESADTHMHDWRHVLAVEQVPISSKWVCLERE